MKFNLYDSDVDVQCINNVTHVMYVRRFTTLNLPDAFSAVTKRSFFVVVVHCVKEMFENLHVYKSFEVFLCVCFVSFLIKPLFSCTRPYRPG